MLAERVVIYAASSARFTRPITAALLAVLDTRLTVSFHSQARDDRCPRPGPGRD